LAVRLLYMRKTQKPRHHTFERYWGLNFLQA
jgi:hypothetical protein